ncbi:unnamed protein product [Effrenium voratum]|uniref:MACPF domain-containing protein n=1 Tax=Effrenium voratum TaxID=2562239 RepID=A0AA36MLB1_9DINO|nr:unnamed protein product [Effrenium voratum]
MTLVTITMWPRLVSLALSVVFVLASQTETNPALPSANLLGAGFDSTTGSSPAENRPVLTLNWSQGKTFANPKDPSITYNIPDELFVTVQTHLDSDVTTAVSYTVSSYAHSQAAGISLSGGGKLAGSPFSANAAVEESTGYLSQRSKYSAVIMSEMYATVYQATLPNPASMTLAEGFLSDVQELPAYTPGSREYASFLQRYGTHVILGAYFGGTGVSKVFLNAELAQGFATSDIAAQAGIKFRFAAQLSSEDAQSWFNGNEQAHSEIHTYMSGGDPGLASDLSHWSAWVSSFFKFPALVHSEKFQMSLVDIADLVPAEKRGNVSLAVHDYVRAKPYPTDPDCAGSVFCNDGCCKKGSSCCYDSSGKSSCCDGLLDTCCKRDDGSAYACNADSTCCFGGCCGGDYPGCCSDGCCPDGYGVCCSDGCCPDGYGVCCEADGDSWCCADGHDCWAWAHGCNPFAGSSESKAPRRERRSTRPTNPTSLFQFFS